MKEVLIEYGGMILAMAGTAALLTILNNSLFSENGLLAQLILFWESGGYH